MLSFIYRNNKGQALIEVIIAMAIFSVVGAAMATMVVGGYNALNQGGDQTEAEALAQEGIEAVRSIRDGAWNEIKYDQSGVEDTSGEWDFLGEGTTETIGKYTRTIEFEAVCRDANDDDNIMACPGTYTDVHSIKIIVTVSWENIRGGISEVEKIAYFSNWDSSDWITDTLSEWEDDPIFVRTATSTTYGDGEIILEEQS